MGNEKLDEVALNTLLLNGVDVPTAYAGSIEDSTSQPASRTTRSYFDAGLVVGLVLFILYWLW